MANIFNFSMRSTTSLGKHYHSSGLPITSDAAYPYSSSAAYSGGDVSVQINTYYRISGGFYYCRKKIFGIMPASIIFFERFFKVITCGDVHLN